MEPRPLKFKRRKTYRALFLSDIHFLVDGGVKAHSHRELFAMLETLRRRGVRFRELYLVGDIIENWYFSATSRMRRDRRALDELFKRLHRLVAKGGRKFFIIGNHDTTSFSMALDPAIERYLRKRRWRVGERFGTDDMIVIHGHQGQYNKLVWVFSIAVLRVLHLLAQVWKGLFRRAERFYNRHLNHEDPRTLARRLQFYDRLRRLVGQGQRTLIVGHTHRFLCMPERRVLNTGDWVHSRSFIVRDDRRRRGTRYLGVRFCEPDQFELEFEFIPKAAQRSSG